MRDDGGGPGWGEIALGVVVGLWLFVLSAGALALVLGRVGLRFLKLS